MYKPPDKYLAICACLVLALTTLAVFGRVYNYDFVNYDDYKYVVENQHIKTGLTRNNIVNKDSALEEYEILKSLDEKKATALLNLIYPDGLSQVK